jgi:fumarate hydratase, class II
MTMRQEQDSMGTVDVPKDAYYGAQTQRALENFPISGLSFPKSFIKTLALIKRCAARANSSLGLLDRGRADAIAQAAQEIIEGRMADQFVLDVFQTGSGTSTNMNANEVLAARANELVTGVRGSKHPIHPNDHVNLGQSSNDVIPSALHVAALTQIQQDLIPALNQLRDSLAAKAKEFSLVMKIGRTHLQDALPIALGQEFGGYAQQITLGVERLRRLEPSLAELALGGTAVGNGANTHPQFALETIARISKETGCQFREASNHFEAQGAQDAAVEASGALKTVAVSLMKIANDIRWLASGPRAALGEILLPELQPGSSIMPGKVNPVIPEVVIQVAAQVVGNDAAITLGGMGGTFELNTMLPLIIHNLLQSIELLTAAARVFSQKCIDGIQAHRERCTASLENNLALATYLVPMIGYDRAAALAHEAARTGRTIRQVALDAEVLPSEQLHRILDAALQGRSPAGSTT